MKRFENLKLFVMYFPFRDDLYWFLAIYGVNPKINYNQRLYLSQEVLYCFLLIFLSQRYFGIDSFCWWQAFIITIFKTKSIISKWFETNIQYLFTLLSQSKSIGPTIGRVRSVRPRSSNKNNFIGITHVNFRFGDINIPEYLDIYSGYSNSWNKNLFLFRLHPKRTSPYFH